MFISQSWNQKHRFEVITAVVRPLKIVVFWDMAPFSLVEKYQHFKGTCSLHPLPKHWCLPTKLPDITSQTPLIFIVTTMRSSNTCILSYYIPMTYCIHLGVIIKHMADVFKQKVCDGQSSNKFAVYVFWVLYFGCKKDNSNLIVPLSHCFFT